MVNAITRQLQAWSIRAPIAPLNKKLLRDLWRLKGQGLAIAAVLAAGLAVLVASFGCIASLNESKDAFYERYRFADVFVSLKRAPNSVAERLKSIPGIAHLETRVVVSVALDLPQVSEPATGQLISIPEGQHPILNDIELRRGRLVAPGRVSEVIISEAFADAQGLTLGDQISATINGKKRRLDIVGIALTPEYVYSLAPGQVMPDDKRFGILWMGRKALAAAFDLDEAFNNVTATLLRGAREKDVLDRIDDILKPYGGLGAYGRQDQISHFFLTNELAQLKTTGTIAPIIFLAVAAFLLNIVVTRLVATEREQIGLLKAFGYTDYEVAWQYLKLLMALTGVGLALGLASGFWLGQAMTSLYAAYFRFPLLTYQIEPEVFSIAALVSLTAAGIGGLGAVYQAARLSPAVAMAPPLPTSYQRSRFSDIFSRLRVSQPTRMIFRHVTRWPMRTGLTITGIALSVGILVASLFFIDTVRQVISVVFFEAERQTLTVSFVEPRGAVVEESIRRMPGVLATQPVRSVSAKLSHGQFTKRTAINGIAHAASLNRILDADVRPIAPPAGGIALSRQIAEQIHANLGDIVTVEIMQERRQVVDLPVTEIVEEYMGFSAYMSLEALNRLMKEGATVTGIHVLADTDYIDELYADLKNTPATAGVSLTSAARISFQETMDSTMYVMITIYVGFASLIAFGVSYNSARIALSERARALASLRVLGFTSGEVAYILLGELGLQTVIALPLGCILGYGLAQLMSPMLSTEMYNFPLVIADSTYGIAMAVVAAAAILCGAMVCRRVYRLDLVTALKTRE